MITDVKMSLQFWSLFLLGSLLCVSFHSVPCEANLCSLEQIHVVSDSTAHSSCMCSLNYVFNGSHCIELNPCLVSFPCDQNSTRCISHKVGSFSCPCLSDYFRNDKFGDESSCHPKNVCLVLNGDCDDASTVCTPTGCGTRRCVCREGFYDAGDETSCQDCSTLTPNCDRCTESACTHCAAGYHLFSGTGEAICVSNCLPGHFFREETLQCEECRAGTYNSVATAHRCLNCPEGTASGTGASQCLSCSLGYFAPGIASSTCTRCNAGSYAGSPGLSACALCAQGSYSDRPGASKCKLCAPGSYADEQGKTVCSICPAGHTSGSGASACGPCNKGYFNPRVGAPDCYACPAGTYGPSLGLTACTPCSKGFYSDTHAEFCFPCRRGYYNSNEGQQFCTACAPGSYAPEEGSSVCSYCSRGRWSNIGAVECVACPGGSACDGVGHRTDCGPGLYSMPAAAECSECKCPYYSFGDNNLGCSKCLGTCISGYECVG
eukprot:GCRY01001600.1.p1 GENE.GCRY01001600.1~~GCRY01001600.1.p1  ORF type:complete len:491 (+),score=28.65 GCRY01001600.1:181-1653(+)